MDDMGASRHREVFVLFRLLQEAFLTDFEVAQDYVVSVALQEDDSRVHDVLARRAPVDELSRVVRQHRFEGAEQRHDGDGALVVFADGGDVEKLGLRVLVDRVGLLLRDDAELALRFRKRRLGIEPLLGPALVAPNLSHFVRAEHAPVNLAVNGCRWHD